MKALATGERATPERGHEMLPFATIICGWARRVLAIDEVERTISQGRWLSRQPPMFRTVFFGLGRLNALQRGAPFFRTGDASGGVFGVVSGCVAVLLR